VAGRAAIDGAFAADLLGKLQAAMSSRDVDRVLELTTADVVYDDMGDARAIRGREEMANLLRPILAQMTAFELELVDSFVGLDGAKVAAHWSATARRAQDDEPVPLEFVTIYTIRDGKIARFTIVFRHMGWLGSLWP